VEAWDKFETISSAVDRENFGGFLNAALTFHVNHRNFGKFIHFLGLEFMWRLQHIHSVQRRRIRVRIEQAWSRKPKRVSKKKEERPTRPIPSFFSKEYLDFHHISEETLINGRSNRSRNRRKARPKHARPQSLRRGAGPRGSSSTKPKTSPPWVSLQTGSLSRRSVSPATQMVVESMVFSFQPELQINSDPDQSTALEEIKG
jgi:hypothetical protein